MAKIDIVYFEKVCEKSSLGTEDYFDDSCFGDVYGNRTCCKHFTDAGELNKDGFKTYGCGCVYANYRTMYLGVETNDYEVAIIPDDGWDEEHADVRIGKKMYWCTKVTIDGEVVYENKL